MNKNLALHIESLIFASEKPITVEDITNVVEETMEVLLDPGQVDEAIQLLREKYESEDFAIEIIEISGGYAFMTKGAYHLTISNYLKQTTTKKLSKAALETLSIIAYKQPVSKSEIESIRGVNCDYAIQKLLEKELIEIKGRSEGLGKPLLYGTSEKFFDYFGLRGVQDLPKLKDFEMPENTIGVPSPEEIETPVMVDGESVHLSASTIVLEAEELLEEEQSGLTIVEDIEEEADASASDEFTDIQE
ncbi:MAG: SMC-Scp complex subunit ScpB [Saprospiraceae bacterium]|nr:SMC-Scp complex subunit ScpB [Saprospiraceae bacterium]